MLLVIWLGEKRGNLSDWTTQQWVRLTGRRLALKDHLWLDGPIGETRQIGKEFFERYAEKAGLTLRESGTRGLIPNFEFLESGNPSLRQVAKPVRDFYEQTSQYDLDAWSEWRTPFKPFGSALSLIFSKRLQQLNVPLSGLDSSKGMSSRVVQLIDPATDEVIQTAWVRKLHATGNVIYAGSYSVCRIPGFSGACVKVVFPLPNGNAIVLMKPEGHADGSLTIRSVGNAFGDPGFYFVVHGDAGIIWTRYVPTMKEKIRVYPAAPGNARADHTLWIWGREFLRLHYRMRKMGAPSADSQ
jgi:hypothetical protein